MSRHPVIAAAFRARHSSGMRIGPRHPRLAAACFRLLRPIFERFYARKQIFGPTSKYAAERLAAVRTALDRGETVYLAGIGPAGLHNSGVALIGVSREHGPRIICNNEEERFSGKKHSTEFPGRALRSFRTTIGCGADVCRRGPGLRRMAPRPDRRERPGPLPRLV
jgi:carbamoyltransferase